MFPKEQTTIIHTPYFQNIGLETATGYTAKAVYTV